MTGAPSEDLDQPRHPLSLIRVLTVHIKISCDLDLPLVHNKTGQT